MIGYGEKREREAINRLMEELDAQGQMVHIGETSDPSLRCQRRHTRHAFRADCMVCFFLGPYHEVVSIPGRTRNLSRSGLGILIKRVFNMGEPVEVQVQLPRQPMMYMAGIAQFSRYAGRGYHELGIALKSVGKSPVFSDEPNVAIATQEWINTALQVFENRQS